jgi:predicted ATPase/class 3 adenylate cyclase
LTVALPTGTITMLFSDIEGSTRLLRELGDCYGAALADHHQLLRRAFAEHGGVEVDTQGDAFFVAFARARDAVAAAVAAQRALATHPWRDDAVFSARMGIHTGEPTLGEGGYVGLDVHRAARICSAGHGGQVLLSKTTRDLLGSDDLARFVLQDLGEHRLKDLPEPEHLHQLTAPGLRCDFPPLKTLDGRPTNLPAQVAALVGREREVADVVGRLRDEGTRAITLTGPGGIGKTRLAVRVGTELLPELPDGVFAVDLTALREPERVVPTIAQTLALTEGQNRTADEALVDFLRGRRPLLILDNFEHLLAGAHRVAELLEALPGLKVLITSRAPLRIAAEHEYAVPPLAVGDAVALFADRARAVRADFELTERNAAAATEVCTRLDGLPLAIELAAARMRHFSAPALLSRLTTRMALLTRGPRDLPTRQQTLRATLDWSHDLLDVQQRRLFARLAVFVGGATPDAVEEVCEGDLDTLASLLDASLVRHEESEDGESRYRMLETVREYACERLDESDEGPCRRDRHAQYFVDLAEALESELWGGPRQGDAVTRLEAEHDNVRAALDWLSERGAVALRSTLTAAVWRFWLLHGDLQEGERWLELALADPESASPELRANIMFGAAMLARRRGKVDRAEALARKQEALCLQSGDRRGLAYAALALGVARQTLGDVDSAREAYERCRALSHQVGDAWGANVSVTNLGDLALTTGDYAAAVTLSGEAAALARGRHDNWTMALSLTNLAFALVLQGDEEAARPLLDEGMVVSQRIESRELIGVCLEGLAAITARTDPQRAGCLLGAVDALAEELGISPPPAEQRLRERTLATLASRLEPDALARARERGCKLLLAEAIEEGLQAAHALVAYKL